MSGELRDFMVNEVTVRTLTGVGGLGETYAAPYTFNVCVDDTRQLVRDKDGQEVVSSTTIYDDELGRTNVWQLGSKVLLPSGRTATVISVARRENDLLELPEHIEVKLT